MSRIIFKPIFIILLLALLFLPSFAGGGRSWYVPGLFLIGVSLLLFVFYNMRADQKHQLSASYARFKLLPLNLWLAFLIFALIALFFSISTYASISSYILILGYFVLFYVVSQTIFSDKEIKIIGNFLIVGAVMLSIIGIYYYLTGRYVRMMSTFYWPNPFAGYLLFIIPLALGLYYRSSDKFKVTLYGAVSILLLSVFVLTESRASYLSLIIPVILLIWIFIGLVDSKKGLLIKNIFLVVSVFILVSIIFSFKIGSPTLFFLTKNQSDPVALADVGVVSRIEYWQGAVGIFKDYPIFGSGLDTYRIIYPAYQSTPIGYSIYAHNSYLQMLAETGILAGLAFILIMISLLIVGRGLLKTLEGDTSYTFLFLLGVLGSMIHNAADFDWSYLANAIIFWILAGLVYSRYLKEHDPNLKYVP